MADKKIPGVGTQCPGDGSTRNGNDARSITWGFAEHLKYTLGEDRFSAADYDRFMALAYTVRDRILHRWIKSRQLHRQSDVKRVYYLSLEFLIGRAMNNNVMNLGLETEVRKAMEDLGYRYEEIADQEVDAGLGNGGLGRLAACFMDSMATMSIPAIGYGLRYDYGIFRQKIENGMQVEQPDDWLRWGNPWEIERPDVSFPVHFGGRVESSREKGIRIYRWVDTQPVVGIAYDMPVVGYGGDTVNTLRLWSARAAEEFDFEDFNAGDYVEAVSAKVMAENLTKVLYPNDKLYLGKELRLRQQYFFVASSLRDIIRRFRETGKPWELFHENAAIQLNDTHPSLAVPEFMRILLDEEELAWDEAWDVTVRTMGYTNHTLMPEALEKWPIPMLEHLLPRHLQIIFEINHRFLQKAITVFPGNTEKLAKVSLVEESEPKQIRMANLSIVGTHSTNGVAALHTELLRTRLVPEMAEIFPDRFNNKTNGITQRRWLLHSNPPLAKLITGAIGDGWITDFSRLSELAPFAEDAGFREDFGKAKLQAKKGLSEFLLAEQGYRLKTDSIFDVQVKRIHEYKRQLLNALHIVMLYNRIRQSGSAGVQPRTFLFAGKAAPGYAAAKLIIKLINNIAQVVNSDARMRGTLAVHFIPNYRVSLAEKIIPATDLSEQISTAGTEASGTGNMKFMCNGALTIGTLDGANIEIAEEAGKENLFLFGLKADEAEELIPRYNPLEFLEQDDEMREAVELLFSGHFNFAEPGIFDPLRDMLLKGARDGGDRYLHLADLRSYADAQARAEKIYREEPEQWKRMAILNIASAGKFSSDRTIADYSEEIWGAVPRLVGNGGTIEEILEDARALPERRREWKPRRRKGDKPGEPGRL
jgi:starch phosphorylase